MVLELKGLGLVLGRRVLAAALSAYMEPGQLWCVLGRNGAGKSTLLRSLAGLRPAEQGEILLDGQRLGAYSVLEMARRRAYLAQQVSDAFSASVLDTVMTARYPFHSSLAARVGFERPEDRQYADRALHELGLSGWGERDVLTLSGGERRLVAVATVLAQDVPLLLLDEPAAHLDVDVSGRVFEVLAARASAGALVIASVHEPNLAARHATHAILLQPGGKTLAGPVSEVLLAAELSKTFVHRIEQVEFEGQVRFLTA
jgi:iron complex transport system ATP-binding protein